MDMGKYNPVRGCLRSRRIMRSTRLKRFVKRETNRAIRRTKVSECPMISIGHWG